MKFKIDLTEKEYHILMEKFGEHSPNGANRAIRRLIGCVKEFEHATYLPIKHLHSRIIYRDNDLIITLNPECGIQKIIFYANPQQPE